MIISRLCHNNHANGRCVPKPTPRPLRNPLSFPAKLKHPISNELPLSVTQVVLDASTVADAAGNMQPIVPSSTRIIKHESPVDCPRLKVCRSKDTTPFL